MGDPKIFHHLTRPLCSYLDSHLRAVFKIEDSRMLELFSVPIATISLVHPDSTCKLCRCHLSRNSLEVFRWTALFCSDAEVNQDRRRCCAALDASERVNAEPFRDWLVPSMDPITFRGPTLWIRILLIEGSMWQPCTGLPHFDQFSIRSRTSLAWLNSLQLRADCQPIRVSANSK